MRICVLFDCRLRCLRRPRLFIGVSAVTNFTFETLLTNWKETGKGTSYGRDSDSDGNNVLQKIAILSRQTSRLYFILCLDSFPLPLRDRQITLIMCTKISPRMSGSRKQRSRNDKSWKLHTQYVPKWRKIYERGRIEVFPRPLLHLCCATHLHQDTKASSLRNKEHNTTHHCNRRFPSNRPPSCGVHPPTGTAPGGNSRYSVSLVSNICPTARSGLRIWCPEAATG
jgi:hypothetical protein